MTTTNRYAALAATLALTLSASALPARADSSLTDRAVTALGAAIAAQGNAALIQIRREMTSQWTAAVQLFVPPTARIQAPEAVQLSDVQVVASRSRIPAKGAVPAELHEPLPW